MLPGVFLGLLEAAGKYKSKSIAIAQAIAIAKVQPHLSNLAVAGDDLLPLGPRFAATGAHLGVNMAVGASLHHREFRVGVHR